MAAYPADWTAMQTAIAAWIAGSLAGLPTGPYAVVWADQDSPRAAKPLVTLKKMGNPRPDGGIATPAITDNVGTGNIDVAIRGPGVVDLEIQVITNTEDMVAAERIRASAMTSQVREDLEDAGIKLPEKLEIRDLSQLFSGLREWRSVIEVPLRLEVRVDFVDLPWIETVADPVITVES